MSRPRGAKKHRRTPAPATALPAANPVGLLAVGVAGLISLVGLYFWLRYVPFQDVPNHLTLLEVDRALRHGASSDVFRTAGTFTFAYSLYIWIDRALRTFVSADHVIRVVICLAAIGVPLAVARVARAIDARPEIALLLSLPLAASWPLRIGLLSYVLGVPFFLWALAAAIEYFRFGRSRSVAELGLAVTLCYVAHPVPWIILGPFIAIAWWFFDRSVPKARMAIAATGCSFVFFAFDLWHHAFAQIPGTEVTWRPSPLVFRAAPEALAQLVTRSYGITDWLALLFYAPLLVAVVRLAVRAAHSSDRPPGRFVFLVSLAALFGGVVAFSANKTVWEVGARLPVLGIALLSAFAAQSPPVGLRRRAALAAICVLPLFHIGYEFSQRSNRIASILHGGGERLGGHFLTARISDCPSTESSPYWGRYDSERHIWTYALRTTASTPYLFAFSRYLPIWYDGETYALRLRAPTEWDANAILDVTDPSQCVGAEIGRLRNVSAFATSSYDGVLVYGMPSSLDALSRTVAREQWNVHRVRDGMLVWLPSHPMPGRETASAR